MPAACSGSPGCFNGWALAAPGCPYPVDGDGGGGDQTAGMGACAGGKPAPPAGAGGTSGGAAKEGRLRGPALDRSTGAAAGGAAPLPWLTRLMELETLADRPWLCSGTVGEGAALALARAAADRAIGGA